MDARMHVFGPATEHSQGLESATWCTVPEQCRPAGLQPTHLAIWTHNDEARDARHPKLAAQPRPQRRLLKLVISLYDRSDYCGAAKAKFATLAAEVAGLVDNSCEKWGEFDLAKVSWLANNAVKTRKIPT